MLACHRSLVLWCPVFLRKSKHCLSLPVVQEVYCARFGLSNHLELLRCFQITIAAISCGLVWRSSHALWEISAFAVDRRKRGSQSSVGVGFCGVFYFVPNERVWRNGSGVEVSSSGNPCQEPRELRRWRADVPSYFYTGINGLNVFLLVFDFFDFSFFYCYYIFFFFFSFKTDQAKPLS